MRMGSAPRFLSADCLLLLPIAFFSGTPFQDNVLPTNLSHLHGLLIGFQSGILIVEFLAPFLHSWYSENICPFQVSLKPQYDIINWRDVLVKLSGVTSLKWSLNM